MESSNKFPPSY